MNLWLRLFWLLASCAWRPGIDDPLGVSRLGFRVWPHDVDTSMHMNNGRYWTLMDLGRVDLIVRSGLWRSVLRKRWTPVVSAGEIRFRRELRALSGFALETQVLGWTDSHMVIEHRMVADGAVAAIALVRAAFYDRALRSYVPIAELMADAGFEGRSPALGDAATSFIAAEDALRAVTADAGDAATPPAA